MTRRSTARVFLLSLAAIGLWQCNPAPRARETSGDVAQAIQQGISRGSGRFDHAKFDAILRATVNTAENRVNYAAVKARDAELDAYLAELARADLKSLSRDHLLALFLNAYNAYTIKSILRTMTPARPGGVASIRDIPNVFKAADHNVGRFRLSLDNIEHNILRPIFRDPRIHFAVSCAAVSCPPIGDRAFTGEQVQKQLEEAARRTLSSPRYVRVEGSRLLLTKVMDWYGADFVKPGYHGAARTLVEYIERYAAPDVRQFIARLRGSVPIEFMAYDWSLNRAN